MILDIIAEVIGKFVEYNFTSKTKMRWIIIGLFFVIILIILLAC